MRYGNEEYFAHEQRHPFPFMDMRSIKRSGGGAVDSHPHHRYSRQLVDRAGGDDLREKSLTSKCCVLVRHQHTIEQSGGVSVAFMGAHFFNYGYHE